MTERLIIALGLLAIVAVAGIAIRPVVRSRTNRIRQSVVLPEAETAIPRLLVFTSRWCSDCETQHAVIEESKERWSRPVTVSYHDAVQEGELARKLGIMMVPAVVIARPDGAILDVRQGLVDEDRLRSLIEAAA